MPFRVFSLFGGSPSTTGVALPPPPVLPISVVPISPRVKRTGGPSSQIQLQLQFFLEKAINPGSRWRGAFLSAWLMTTNAPAQPHGQPVLFGHNLYNNCGETNVPSAAQSGVVAIAAGGTRAVALKNDGSVVAWGGNSCGQTNVPLAAQSGVVAIAAFPTAGHDP